MARAERRVVISGLGPVAPNGVGVGEFWPAAREGRVATDALTELPDGFAVEAIRSRVVARVRGGPSGSFRVHGVDADRRAWLARAALRCLLQDAHLVAPVTPRTALVFGNAVGAPAAVESIYLDGEVRAPIAPGEFLRQMSFNSIAVELAELAGVTGPVLTISTGCTAGLDAVATAFDLVRSGRVDAAIAGSAEAPLTPVVMAAFDLIGATTRRNQEPTRASRPFDRGRDGFVLAEGASLVLLEERARAVRRGAPVYAEIRGSASVSNAFHMTNLPAEGAALARCIRAALVDAELPAEAIDHVSAHGSSTQQNDLCETNAIKAALGPAARRVTVNALKSMVGHALGASNAIEVACCALELRDQFVCPTANLEEPGDGCDLDYVGGAGRPRRIRHVVKLSNGFSGIHTALVLSQPEEGRCGSCW